MYSLILLVHLCCKVLLLLYPVGTQECVGDCVKILQCPSLNSIRERAIAGNASPDDIITLRNSVCARDDSGHLRVCCPFPKPKLNKNCGLTSYEEKIVNGEDASLGQWPWMVIFRARECLDCEGTCKNCTYGDPGRSNWVCGGVLITEQYVLTAAHCFTNTQIEYARIGEFDLSRTEDRNGGITAPPYQNIAVDKVITHEEYGSPCRRCNDIALVKLSEPAVMHEDFVSSICVPVDPINDIGFRAAEFYGQSATATGWGVTDASKIFDTHGSDKLQQVELKIQDSSRFCLRQKSLFPEGSIMCAGQGDGKGTCRADSGGPLMLNDIWGQKWYIVGITSFGATVCGAKDHQEIFTSVYNYTQWIQQKLL